MRVVLKMVIKLEYLLLTMSMGLQGHLMQQEIMPVMLNSHTLLQGILGHLQLVVRFIGMILKQKLISIATIHIVIQ